MKLAFDQFNNCYTGVYYQVQNLVDGRNAEEHEHDFYEIFVLLHGSALHYVNDSDQPLCKGDAVYIRPSDRHFYKNCHDARILNIAFTPQIMNGMSQLFNRDRLRDILDAPNPVVKHLEAETVERFVSEIQLIAALDSKDTMWEFELKQLIFRLFACGIYAPKNQYLPGWLDDLISKMKIADNYILGTKRLFELSKKSPEHVSRQMRRYLNLSPSEFVNRQRINYAKNCLALTDEDISTICYDVGFENLNYFYRLFRRETGLPPLKYRNLNQGKKLI